MSQTPDADVMVKFQFEADDDLWYDWKHTVPRDKSLEQRIIELLEADRDGRVVEVGDASEDENDTDTRERDPTPTSEVEPEPASDDREDQALDQYRETVAGSGQKQEARAQALLRMRNYIREHGTATKQDLLPVVDPDDVMLGSEDSVWSNMVKGQLGAVEELESDHDGTWRWVGDEK